MTSGGVIIRADGIVQADHEIHKTGVLALVGVFSTVIATTAVFPALLHLLETPDAPDSECLRKRRSRPKIDRCETS